MHGQPHIRWLIIFIIIIIIIITNIVMAVSFFCSGELIAPFL